LIGAAAAGVTSIASAPTTASLAVAPANVGIPLPLEPAADAASNPSTPELTGILTKLADPAVPFKNKSYLVDGGIGLIEGKTADRLLANANSKGYLPLQISVSNVQPAGANQVSATVTASGPQMAPTTQNVTFVNNGGWKLTKDSALNLLSAASASG
jgi:hypothetical protein